MEMYKRAKNIMNQVEYCFSWLFLMSGSSEENFERFKKYRNHLASLRREWKIFLRSEEVDPDENSSEVLTKVLLEKDGITEEDLDAAKNVFDKTLSNKLIARTLSTLGTIYLEVFGEFYDGP